MYIVAIPSYDRAEVCRDNVLTMLKNQNVKASQIDIFVANKEEAELYKIIPTDMYRKIIIGKKGLLQQVQFIIKYYPEGQHIVRLDDDVKKIFKKVHTKAEQVSRKKMRVIKLLNLNTFFTQAFKTLQKEHLTLWGVNKTLNPYFMTDGYSTDLRLIVGAVNGWINTHSKDYEFKLLKPENSIGEDIENTLIRYINDGGVLRFNDVGFMAGKVGQKGGIQSAMGNDKRMQVIKYNNKLFTKHYGKYGEVVPNTNQGEVFMLYRNPHRAEGEGILYDDTDLI
jgi:hypothetical protein